MPQVPKYGLEIDTEKAIKSFQEFFELQEHSEQLKWLNAFKDLEHIFWVEENERFLAKHNLNDN